MVTWSDSHDAVLILALPWPQIWGLHMSLSRRLQIAVVFMLGYFVVGADVARLVLSLPAVRSRHVSHDYSRTSPPRPDAVDSWLISTNDRQPRANHKLEAGGSQRQPDMRMPSHPEAAAHPSPHSSADNPHSGLRDPSAHPVTPSPCAFQLVPGGLSLAPAAHLHTLYICRGLANGFCWSRHRLL